MLTSDVGKQPSKSLSMLLYLCADPKCHIRDHGFRSDPVLEIFVHLLIFGQFLKGKIVKSLGISIQYFEPLRLRKYILSGTCCVFCKV
jgi:hypothetical protein